MRRAVGYKVMQVALVQSSLQVVPGSKTSGAMRNNDELAPVTARRVDSLHHTGKFQPPFDKPAEDRWVCEPGAIGVESWALRRPRCVRHSATIEPTTSTQAGNDVWAPR